MQREEHIAEANKRKMCQVPGTTGEEQGQRLENMNPLRSAGFAGCSLSKVLTQLSITATVKKRAIQSASEPVKKATRCLDTSRGLISPGRVAWASVHVETQNTLGPQVTTLLMHPCISLEMFPEYILTLTTIHLI